MNPNKSSISYTKSHFHQVEANRTPTAALIQKLIESTGLTIRAIARISGVSHTHIGDMAKGESSPTLEKLEMLAPVLGVEAWELAAGKTKEELFREILGQQTKEEDPVFQSLRKIAEQEGGIEQLKELVKFAKNDPANIRKAIQVVEIWNQQDNK